MNFYIVSLLDSLAEQNLSLFCRLNFVKNAALFSDFQDISTGFKSVTDFYFSFLKKLEILPYRALLRNYFGYYDLTAINSYDRTVSEVLGKLSEKASMYNEVQPIQVRYAEGENMHMAVGISKIENIKSAFLHIADLCLPKDEIKSVPSGVSYVAKLLDMYTAGNNGSVREFIEGKGYNYYFQRDCKLYFNDSFYSFWLKGRMMDAARDIIFTRMRLKEVAFKNKFLDYQNMYKTFLRHGVCLKTMPRLAGL